MHRIPHQFLIFFTSDWQTSTLLKRHGGTEVDLMALIESGFVEAGQCGGWRYRLTEYGLMEKNRLAQRTRQTV